MELSPLPVILLLMSLQDLSDQVRPQTVLNVSPQSWLIEGVSVTLSCEVRNSSTGWTFSWYRAVPYRRGLTQELNIYGSVRYSVVLLSDSSRGAGGSYTLSPAALHHTGVYVCRAERGEPANQTQYSNLQPLWITDESPPVSLIISPNRTQHFKGESLSLSCEGQSDSTGWSVRIYTPKWGLVNCSSVWGSVTGSTCTISVLYSFHTGVYWCQSESGGSSNPVNITVHKRLQAVLSVSPQNWLTEGVSVTLSCKVSDSSTGWTFSWYRVVPYREGVTLVLDIHGYVRYSVDLLSDSSRGAGGSFTLSPAALHHTGVYVCRAERGEAPYETEYSNLQPLWITGESAPVSLIISPNRTQHFSGDSLTLSCEGQSESTGWRVRQYTNSERVSDCSSVWGSGTGSICTIRFLSHSGVYWCRSESGGSSNPVNITVHSESPTVSLIIRPNRIQHFYGDSLTLSCEGQRDSTGWKVRGYRHSGRVSDCSSDWGSVKGSTCTISFLVTSHTGLYWCQSESGGSSNPVNITVHSECSPCLLELLHVIHTSVNSTTSRHQRSSSCEYKIYPLSVLSLTALQSSVNFSYIFCALVVMDLFLVFNSSLVFLSLSWSCVDDHRY
ncbi:Fc receptor-like protein 5 [Brachyhypopomus gauderio]|uniref:Fc receptor-like protein 5 n=1 Tax=Brachyhypopomus gauderio TaxID=698409 RepID=UPI0040434146